METKLGLDTSYGAPALKPQNSPTWLNDIVADPAGAAPDWVAWYPEGAVSQDQWERCLQHPRFNTAARALAANMLAAADENKELDSLFKDAGRYVAAMLSIHLQSSGGLTLPRLQAFCTESGFAGPGRARAMLFYLQYLRYIEPLPRVRGTPQAYTATAPFKAAWMAHTKAALKAIVELEPAVDVVLQAIDQPDVFGHFTKSHVDSLFASAALMDKASPLVRILLNRYAGHQVLAYILSEGEDDFPPRSPLPLSVAAAAKRFSVSRIHLHRLLNAAQAAGLFVLDAEGAVMIAEPSRPDMRRFYAQQLSQLLSASGATLKVIGGTV
jgi:hypothetical protein